MEILRICIFCKLGTDRTSFNKKAHIIPRFLGSDVVLQRAYECDQCNEKFGKNIEAPVSEEEFGFFRALLNIPRIDSKGRTKLAPDYGDNGLKVRPTDRNNLHSGNPDFITEPNFIIEAVEGADSKIKHEFDPLDKELRFSWQRRNVCHLARLIHEFAKNFHNFIFYNQLCNLGQKSLFRWNNWQVQYLRQFLRFYEFFGLVSRLLSKMLIEATAEVHGARDVFSSVFEPHRNNALGKVSSRNEFIPYSVRFIPGGISGAFIVLMPPRSLALVFFAGVTAYFMPLYLNGTGYLERYGFKRVQPDNIPPKIQQHIA